MQETVCRSDQEQSETKIPGSFLPGGARRGENGSVETFQQKWTPRIRGCGNPRPRFHPPQHHQERHTGHQTGTGIWLDPPSTLHNPKGIELFRRHILTTRQHEKTMTMSGAGESDQWPHVLSTIFNIIHPHHWLLSLSLIHPQKGVDLEAIQDPSTRDGMQPWDKTTLL